MHTLVVFGLIINIISRFIGAIVSYDMFSKTKDKRHLLQVIGWIFLLISGFLPFGANWQITKNALDITREFNGGAEGSRTLDLLRARQAL